MKPRTLISSFLSHAILLFALVILLFNDSVEKRYWVDRSSLASGANVSLLLRRQQVYLTCFTFSDASQPTSNSHWQSGWEIGKCLMFPEPGLNRFGLLWDGGLLDANTRYFYLGCNAWYLFAIGVLISGWRILILVRRGVRREKMNEVEV